MSEGLRPDRDSERSLTVAGTDPPNAPRPAPVRRLKVATYEDPFASTRRQLIRIGLVFVAPIVSVIAVGLIVFWVLNSTINITAPPPTTEGQVISNLPDVPLPGGLRPLSRNVGYDTSQLANNLVNSWIPFYDVTTLGTEIFNTSKKLDELVTFYNDQLVKTNRWQLFKRSQFRAHTYLLYVRGTNNPRVVDGIFIDIETLGEDNFSRRGSLLDRQAKIGDNIIILFKQRLIQQT
jgi:hypothetical protein